MFSYTTFTFVGCDGLMICSARYIPIEVNIYGSVWVAMIEWLERSGSLTCNCQWRQFLQWIRGGKLSEIQCVYHNLHNIFSSSMSKLSLECEVKTNNLCYEMFLGYNTVVWAIGLVTTESIIQMIRWPSS